MSLTRNRQSIVVYAPIHAVYCQWSRFESFPRFMTGVARVTPTGPDLFHFDVIIAGYLVSYDACVTERSVDRKIAWQSVCGKRTGGIVTFEPLDATRTKITLEMTYIPRGALETFGERMGMISRQMRGDLKRFKELIEDEAQAPLASP